MIEPKREEQHLSFSLIVRHHLQKKGWKAAYLAQKSNLSKTTISRILRDRNDKGSSYLPTDSVVMSISLAFGLNRNEWEELTLAAFPERIIWLDALDHHDSVANTNVRLYEQGLPLLGNVKDE